MDLGEAILTLTVDESGIVSGFARAKGAADEHLEDTKEQTENFKGMWSSAMAVLSAAGLIAAIEGLKKLIAVGEELVNAFAEDERAVLTLTMALATNAAATDKTIFSLHSWAQEMQQVTEFTNDQTEAGFTLLSGMGMTEEKMKEVMTAAMNLASVYGIDLEMAVRGLASSLESGTLGMLTRQIPTLRQFTEDQLKAGAAINWVAAQYPDAAKLIGDTTSGLQARLRNMLDEQKEKIGEVIAASYAGIEDLLGSIDRIGTISAKVVDILIRSLLTLGAWLGFSYNTFVGFFQMVTALTIDVARVLWAPIEYFFHAPIQAVKVAFAAALNWLLDQAEGFLRRIGEAMAKIPGIGDILGLKEIDLGQITVIEAKIQPLGDALKKIWEDAKGSAAAFTQGVIDGAEGIAEIWTRTTPTLVDKIGQVQEALGKLQGTVNDTAALYAELAKTSVGETEVMVDDMTALLAGWSKAAEGEAKKVANTYKVTFSGILQTATQMISQLNAVFGQYYTNQYTELDNWYQAQLTALGDMTNATEEQLAAKEKLDEEYEKRRSEIKKQEWKSNRSIAIANVIIDTIAAVVKTLAAYPWPWNLIPAAIVAALGAVQLGLIMSQPEPEFSQGGDFIVPPGYPDDSYRIRVESGEHVTVTPAGADEQMIHNTLVLDGVVLADWYTRASRNRRILTTARSVVP